MSFDESSFTNVHDDGSTVGAGKSFFYESMTRKSSPVGSFVVKTVSCAI